MFDAFFNDLRIYEDVIQIQAIQIQIQANPVLQDVICWKVAGLLQKQNGMTRLL